MVTYNVELADAGNPATGQGSPLRYAIADLYKPHVPARSSREVGDCMMVTKQQQQKPAFPDYPVNVEDIIAKVLWAEVPPQSGGDTKAPVHGLPSNAWLFARYPHFTAYVDPQADVDSEASSDDEDDFIVLH